jgi:hypothetical protein
MKFRQNDSSLDQIPGIPVPLRKIDAPEPLSAPENESSRLRSLWRRGLLVITSAAFGGIAVAIWNRRTLAQIRQQTNPDETENQPQLPE